MRKQMIDVLDIIASGDAPGESLAQFIESLEIIIEESGFKFESKPYFSGNSGTNVIAKNARFLEKGKSKADHLAYFIYLFSYDGERCYLSLNTKDLTSRVNYHVKNAETTKINLQSNWPIKNNATADFENSNLFSFEYIREAIPDEATLRSNLGEIIRRYEQLTPLDEDLLTGNTYLKTAFQSWMNMQKKSDGKNYAYGTVNAYTTALKNSTAKLQNINVEQSDLFNYSSLEAFQKAYNQIIAAPNFNEVDISAGNKAFSCGMVLYRRFLEERDGEEQQSDQADGQKFRQDELLEPEKTNSLHKLIEDFEANYDDNELNSCEQLLEEFLTRFPRAELHNLTLEQYALGKTPSGSLSWWLEYNTISLGSIRGGSAVKHIIYYSKKEGDWKIPTGWDSIAEVWEKLRADMVDLLALYDHDPYGELSADSLMIRANMVKGKLLFMYHSDLFLPIYLLDHLQTFLTVLNVPKEQWIGKDNIQCNLLLNKTLKANELLSHWHPVKLKDFLYVTYFPEQKYFKIAPGKDAFLWPQCREGGYICMGWDEMGNLTQYPDYDEFKNAFQSQGYQETPSKNTEKANELWQFYNLKTGDQVVVNKGKSQILAIGTVNSKGYEFKDNLESHKHVVHVQWETIYEPPIDIPEQNYWPMKTVYELSKKQVLEWKKSNVVNKGTAAINTLTYSQADELFFNKLEQGLTRKGQSILFGPPGTGKTFMARRYIEWKHSLLNKTQGDNVEICTFHPSFNYEDFIEGFKPVAGENGTVAFQLEKGIFSRLCAQAHANPETPYFLIIDELNRGNVPKIFGEIITLLEKDKRGMKLRLPQSKENFSIPVNLSIIATMNTSDRSIKMMDTALKRRFAFIECMPQYELLEQEIENLGLSVGTILKALNEALVKFQGRDKQIGHAYLMKNGQALSSLSDLKEVYELEIIPLIQEYCFDNYELLADIVGKGFVNTANLEIRTELFHEHNDAFAAELTKQFKG